MDARQDEASLLPPIEQRTRGEFSSSPPSSRTSRPSPPGRPGHSRRPEQDAEGRGQRRRAVAAWAGRRPPHLHQHVDRRHQAHAGQEGERRVTPRVLHLAGGIRAASNRRTRRREEDGLGPVGLATRCVASTSGLKRISPRTPRRRAAAPWRPRRRRRCAPVRTPATLIVATIAATANSVSVRGQPCATRAGSAEVVREDREAAPMEVTRMRRSASRPDAEEGPNASRT